MVLAGMLASCASAAKAPAAEKPPCPPSRFQQSKMLVIAHAGGEGLGPANTIIAMQRSMAAGADVNDADVHITKDGVLVAIHDATVDATTNGHGNVSDFTLAELQQLDAAWAFAGPNNDFPLRGTGVKIPTIENVLTTFPHRLTSLEFKVGGDAPKAMCELLTRLGALNDVYMSSSDDAYINDFNPRCPTVVSTVTDAMVPLMIAARENGTPYCSPVPIGQPPFDNSRGRPTAESLKWSHDHGMANFTWTVDDPADIKYLAEIGTDGVYTRFPDIARKIVDDLEANKKAKK
jgi:glycerophosphoryl diester phosphodiesterase